ncbi:hypothetical protein EDEG_00531 [Edhazardia aedis USNM 41457]|uniref:Uncharacterized protein n=1 Tax=Edhazardia aedis (strain USNM 41457) TaxID=1003232 RepID=J8ZNJ7_EDHAE|nr:hypothetical protein EDEG_00531 [Edhazardia aedis USNM 41457]|eukprot:EJW01258.1 hypothetical protein EDEG_00531 [Edhazardia aedis USNM 41457]
MMVFQLSNKYKIHTKTNICLQFFFIFIVFLLIQFFICLIDFYSYIRIILADLIYFTMNSLIIFFSLRISFIFEKIVCKNVFFFNFSTFSYVNGNLFLSYSFFILFFCLNAFSNLIKPASNFNI